MATFPVLKTNAVAQYPATKAVAFQNQTLRFLDGVEQRYRDSAGPLHRWELHFEELDETEIAAIAEFFDLNQGQLGSFSFTDPWDGTVYPNCSVAEEQLDLLAAAELRGSASLIVKENRG
jgi:hypothetical protein